MKQIGISFGSWSLDNNDRFPMQVPAANGGTMELVTKGVVYPHFQAMSNELSTPKVLLCPSDEKRSYATNFGVGLTDKNLSYFINVDAVNANRSSLLTGDRNITNRARAPGELISLTRGNSIAWTREMHGKQGYLAFADAGVGAFSNGSVGAAIKIPKGTTNRLAVP